MKLVAVKQPTHQDLTKRFSAYWSDIPGRVVPAPTAEMAIEALKARVIHHVNSGKEFGLASILVHS
jgi:hypothetical protein